jgi:hypothetical protein
MRMTIVLRLNQRTMKPFTWTIFCLSIILFVLVDCKKEKSDPFETAKKSIVGKWEIIEIGNWPNMDTIISATGYKEYLPDGVLKEYEYETGNIFNKKYQVDSLLHIIITREDGFELIFDYNYEFFENNNKLRLDIQAFAIFTTSIYKRID